LRGRHAIYKDDLILVEKILLSSGVETILATAVILPKVETLYIDFFDTLG